jgi:histidinol-phosphate aminotransferase
MNDVNAVRFIKKEVIKLSQYVVPQDLDLIKLNQNESPFDVLPEIKEKIFQRLAKTPWNRYPLDRPISLIKKIANYTNVPENCILVGNSSNELIQTLIYSFCGEGEQIVVVKPGFSVYARAAEIMNIRVLEVPLNQDFTFPVQAIVIAAANAKMIFLASPNNPTATSLDFQQIRTIAASFQGILVMDEAYYEFSGQSAQSLLGEFPNIIILRTFSKAMQMAGARLGYLIAEPECVMQLEKAKLPFSVGVFQQIAGEVMLDHPYILTDNVKRIVCERQRVFAALSEIPGINPVPSDANFILFRIQSYKAADVFRALYQKGVLLRLFSTPELENCLRVSVGTAEENNRFLTVIRDFFTQR